MRTLLLILIASTSLTAQPIHYWQSWFGSYGDTIYVDSSAMVIHYTSANVPQSTVNRLTGDPMLIMFEFNAVRRVRRRQKKYKTFAE